LKHFPADLWILLVANAFVLGLFFIFAVFVFPRRGLSEETKRRPRSLISNALFREYWYFLMEPLKKRLVAWGVSPNTITTWGAIFSVVSAYFFAQGKFGLGGWLVILSATCDVYDGLLARAQGINRKSGAFYDSLLDRVGETFIFGGILWYFKADPVWFSITLIAMTSSQLVSYARARAEGLGFSGSRGLFQRAERMIILSVTLPLSPLFEVTLGWGLELVQLGVFVIAVASAQTAVTRSYGIYKEITATEK
jgi:CDP-diacylglycerol--glycerol-3-phosphate 3-phosphatidyltransferase